MVVVVVVGGGTVAAAAGTSTAGPVLAFVGAILVALITWYATDRRQRRLIAADERRHRAELEAQERRHAAQLAHDRSLRDLDELRRFLDDAAEAFEAVVRRVSELFRLKLVTDEHPDGDLGIRIFDLEKNDGDEFFHLLAVTRRMYLRFPPGHPISAAYEDAAHGLIDEHKALAETPYPITRDSRLKAQERGDQTAEAWQAFLLAAVGVIGAGDTSLTRAAGGQVDVAEPSPPESTEDGGT